MNTLRVFPHSTLSTRERPERTRSTDVPQLNLLAIKPLRVLFLWRGFPYVFQAILLIAFVVLAALGWGLYTPTGANPKLYAKSNLVTLCIWGIWWPAMVWVSVLLGRVWCAVCPLELVGNLSERLGRRLGIHQRAVNRWMAAGFIMVALYPLLQLLVATVQLHRTPAYTSWFLIGILNLAAISGLLWKDRAFCRAFCPVGLLLATYGRGGMLAIRPGTPAICNACPGRDCLRGAHRTKGNGRSCPSLLLPSKLNSSRDCLLCGQCLKACRAGNMNLVLRPWFCKSDGRDSTTSWPVTLFVMLVSGFVSWELCTEWKAAEAVFLAVPEWLLTKRVAGSALTGFVKWAWALVILPALAWVTIAGLIRLLRERRSISQILRSIALPMAVVVSAAHMSKGLAKFVSWAPFLPDALRNPDGLRTVQEITAGSISAPAPLLDPGSVSVLGLGLLTVAFCYAIREYRLANPGSGSQFHMSVPLLVVTLTFSGIVFGWAHW